MSNAVKDIIGALIFSGLNQDNHKSNKLMWSPEFGPPVYRAAMSLSRFNFLLRAIRFDERSTREERVKQDKSAAIRKLWDEFIAQCVKSYISGPHIAVDEQLLAFRGRCAFRMYIANKPAKYGIKLVVACVVESKYMLNAMLYLGTGTTRASPGLTVGHHLTKILVAPYAHSNRNCYD